MVKSALKPILLVVLATLVIVCAQAAEWRDVRKQQQIRQEPLDSSSLKADVDQEVRVAEGPTKIVTGIEYQKLVERRRIAETLYERALIRTTLNDQDKVGAEENKKRQIALVRAKLRLDEARQALYSFTICSCSKSK